MGTPPPHRYKGTFTIDTSNLCFEGFDMETETRVTLRFGRNDIIQLYHEYDKSFQRMMVYGGGLWWAPIRIRFVPESEYGTNALYVVAGFSGLNSLNVQLFGELQTWLS